MMAVMLSTGRILFPKYSRLLSAEVTLLMLTDVVGDIFLFWCVK
jgi:hypothetical protein